MTTTEKPTLVDKITNLITGIVFLPTTDEWSEIIKLVRILIDEYQEFSTDRANLIYMSSDMMIHLRKCLVRFDSLSEDRKDCLAIAEETRQLIARLEGQQ